MFLGAKSPEWHDVQFASKIGWTSAARLLGGPSVVTTSSTNSSAGALDLRGVALVLAAALRLGLGERLRELRLCLLETG